MPNSLLYPFLRTGFLSFPLLSSLPQESNEDTAVADAKGAHINDIHAFKRGKGTFKRGLSKDRLLEFSTKDMLQGVDRS